MTDGDPRSVELRVAAAAFGVEVAASQPLGDGHIHRTWLVTGESGPRLVLQALNRTVFPDLNAMMANIAVVIEHIASPLQFVPVVAPPPERRSGRTGEVRVPTIWTSAAGTAWRAMPFIEGTRSIGLPASTDDVAAAGTALGRFHRAVADLDPARLAGTLPRFHDPARRLRTLVATARRDPCGRGAAVADEVDAVAAAIELLGLAGAPDQTLPERVAHFDAKTDNILLPVSGSGSGVLIDFDTVMPGPWAWDVGDLVRSATGTAPEDAPDPHRVRFDPDRFRALVGSYLEAIGPILTARERRAIGPAALLVTLEQAARFLSDYLAGDGYYRVASPDQNLIRFRVQWSLLQSMLRHRSAMMSE